jgi:hypothetical protein
MAVGIQPRYYCTNIAGGCRHAMADTPFSASLFASFKGQCQGADGPGCGHPLSLGEPLDLRPRWGLVALAAMIGLVVMGWGARLWLFPPALEHLGFTALHSDTVDTAGVLSIEVVRDADVGKAATVDYAAADGSAKAGQDYVAVQGRLRFEPGERRRTLTVSLLPDPSFQKARRHFTVSLLNVRDKPQHTVYITPQAAASSDERLAEQSVRAASVVAKDIADGVVRQRTLNELLLQPRDQVGEFRQYQQLLSTVNGNLTRARESYVQMLRDLKTQQPHTVLGAMDRVAQDFNRKGFAQQGQAVLVMKRQFTELLNHGTTDMDRWAQELSMVIPRVDGRPKATSPSV